VSAEFEAGTSGKLVAVEAVGKCESRVVCGICIFTRYEKRTFHFDLLTTRPGRRSTTRNFGTETTVGHRSANSEMNFIHLAPPLHAELL
jgi:hypothetical protein